MKAIILLDDGSGTTNNYPSGARARQAANACISMGMTVIYLKIANLAPISVAEMEAHVLATGAELVVQPINTSNNRNAFENISVNGLSVPVFILSVAHVATTKIKGVSAFYPDDTSTTAKACAVDGNQIFSYNRRFTLATYTAPENAEAICVGTDDTAAVVAWKYTPDGVKYIYCENPGSDTNTLHMLIQEAVNDGLLNRPPKRAPQFLTIDHLGNGDNGAAGTTGTQLQPEIISTLGDMLRAQKGVCYASLEQSNKEEMNDVQKALLIEYSDVFKYIACHDHWTGTYLITSGYTAGIAPNNAIANQETKVRIDGSYQATKTFIESIGLTVNADLGHFAGNLVGTNFWELAQQGVSILADPLETTPKTGYGFKAARMGSRQDNGESYPNVEAVTGIHWLARRIYMRDILMLGSSRDAGADNGAADDPTKDYSAFRNNTQQHTQAVLTFHHDDDFEEPVGGFISNGSEVSRGVLSWRMGVAYANFCKDTVQFGANILNYI